MVKTGTKEWSDESRNIQLGCEHDCRHCYAKADALRFKRIPNREAWCKPRILQHQLRNFGKVGGRIMFPSIHDITPTNLEYCMEFLKNMLIAGNKVLVVSKPHEACIRRICATFDDSLFKARLTFRFTIGSMRPESLAFWDNKSPAFEERLACLRYAFEKGYNTSVSCEPYFDNTIESVVATLCPYITDTIWLGKLNKFEQRVDTTGWGAREWNMWYDVQKVQTDDYIWMLYNKLKDNPKVRWKESCKKVLGLPEEEIG